MTDVQKLNQKTRAHFLVQVDIYDCAMPLAEALVQNYDLGPLCQSKLEELNGLMNEASRQNEKFTSENPDGLTSILKSVEFRKVASQLTSRISRLMELFERIEQRASALRQNMLPDANQSVKVTRMRSAYSVPRTSD